MKKFITKALLYIITVGIFTILINFFYTAKANKMPSGLEEDKFLNVPDKIDICNMGSSHGVHSYYYKDLEDKYSCFNFALDSQVWSYDARILDYYQDRLKEGTIVIIDITYGECYGIDESEFEEFESKNKRYYHFLPPEYIKNYDFKTDFWVRRFRSLIDGPIDIITALLSKVENTDNIKSYPENYTVIDEALLFQDTHSAAERHIIRGKFDDYGNRIINTEEQQALYEMVDICRTHGAIPIFVTVPYTKEYLSAIDELDPDFFDEFYTWIYSVSEELDVSFYDYSSDFRFIDQHDLFYNGDHMNSVGARKFTNILFEEVLEALLIYVL